MLLCVFVMFVGDDFWFGFLDALKKWWMKVKRRGKR